MIQAANENKPQTPEEIAAALIPDQGADEARANESRKLLAETIRQANAAEHPE